MALKHRSADMQALADTGCQAVCMGPEQLHSVGLSVGDLMPVDLRLSGANWSSLRILGDIFMQRAKALQTVICRFLNFLENPFWAWVMSIWTWMDQNTSLHNHSMDPLNMDRENPARRLKVERNRCKAIARPQRSNWPKFFSYGKTNSRAWWWAQKLSQKFISSQSYMHLKNWHKLTLLSHFLQNSVIILVITVFASTVRILAIFF